MREFAKGVFWVLIIGALSFMPVPGYTALVDYGNGLIYDTGLNITWYDTSDHTQRNLADAKAWAAALNVGGVNGWRLPSTPDEPFLWTYDGNGSVGFNITTSEMGHLFYEELGNKGAYTKEGIPQSGYGLVYFGPFINLQAHSYISGTLQTPLNIDTWYFDFSNGQQDGTPKGSLNHYALAVHDGNVGAPVPIPAGVWLLGSGLVGLVGLRKKFQR